MWVQLVLDALADVRAYGARTALQTVGVVLGVASVVATLGLSAGQRAKAMEFWQETGGTLKVLVYPKPVDSLRLSAKERSSKGLTLEDAQAIAQRIPHFQLVETAVRQRLWVSSPMAQKRLVVTGITPGWAEFHELRLGRGRGLTSEDLTTGAAVCVLGADRAQEFFGSADPIGKSLRVGERAVVVVGVLAYREFYWNRADTWNALGWMNELILVPATTLTRRYLGAGSQRVDEIALRLVSADAHRQALPALRSLLRARHGVEDFQIADRQDRIQQMEQQSRIYDVTFLVCGLVALLVGGIVVANIMLASFTERMREVGIRKALGAKGSHVLVQFLVETVLVNGLGGLGGLLLGIGFVHGMAYLLDQQAVLTPTMIVAAVGCAVSVAVVFGLYPAWRAARLDPVVALRYE
ncbi:MAG: ABC transporter permease [Thermoanaerobaculum sp.]|nr:ABC transporter permease [Thermoanaerobaculum sp.]MDW7966791.1 ABC transporter permease [Thermoanaerobaculum sp.]